MGSSTLVVTDEQIERFDRDGVVCLRGVIAPEWIETLTAGIEKNIAAPSSRGRIWDRDTAGRTTIYDSQVWRDIPEYREFVEHGPMAELAGRLMRSSAVNFYFDAIFTRTPGTQFRTPFHQDEPFWSVEGYQTCSCWMPLVPVEQRSALEFVRGSHRWGVRYAQTNFGALTGDERDQVVHVAGEHVADGEAREPFPDIEGNRDDFEILSWDMEPGDVAIFNARMIHGGSGNLREDRELKVFNTQWLGDDVRIVFRPEGMDPDHSQVMTAEGLGPGDRVGGALYPQLWTRSA
ncbi:MAG: phytanoyl-CoA dioxygenase family protein [Actinomycetota bacterium]